MIFRKIGIVAVAAATIFGIAAAFPTAATAQYYGGPYWHGGFGWGFGRGLPFRFGIPYSYGYGPYYGYRYGYGPYYGYRYYDYGYSGPYQFDGSYTDPDEAVADCLWRRRWANDFRGAGSGDGQAAVIESPPVQRARRRPRSASAIPSNYYCLSFPPPPLPLSPFFPPLSLPPSLLLPLPSPLFLLPPPLLPSLPPSSLLPSSFSNPLLLCSPPPPPLSRKLDTRHVSTREANGRELSYIEGWYAISEANRIFGFDGWNRETVESRCALARENRGSFTAVYTAKVRITVQADGTTIVREGHGSGEGRGTSPGEVHDIALKAAETDATKRTFATFGKPFGLELYRKSHTQKSSPLQPALPTQHTRYGFHPDDTTPIPRPSHYYGRRQQGPITDLLRRDQANMVALLQLRRRWPRSRLRIKLTKARSPSLNPSGYATKHI